jgi:hypothetical protein
MHVRARVTRRSNVAVAAIVLVGALASGCSTHDVAASRPCPDIKADKKAIAISNRGAIGMAKIGLTPENLKAREDCS